MRKMWSLIGKVLLGLIAICLFFYIAFLIAQFIFFQVLIPCFGPEFFIGAQNVIHAEDGNVYYTNPGAMLLWCVLITAGETFLTGLVVLLAVFIRRFRRFRKER